MLFGAIGRIDFICKNSKLCSDIVLSVRGICSCIHSMKADIPEDMVNFFFFKEAILRFVVSVKLLANLFLSKYGLWRPRCFL